MHAVTAVCGFEQCGGGALPLVCARCRSAGIFNGCGSHRQWVGTEDKLVEYLQRGFLVGSGQSRQGGKVETAHGKHLQSCLGIAALQRDRILHEREEGLSSRGSGRRERVGSTAMAADANAGHGLVASSIQISGQKPCAGVGVERKELREFHPASRAGAEFDAVGADVPFRILSDGGIQVQPRVTIPGTYIDVVVFHHECNGAVGIFPPGHAPAIAEVKHVSEHRRSLCSGATVESVGDLPFGQRILSI